MALLAAIFFGFVPMFLFAAFVKPGKARFDNGLTMMPSRRWGVVEIIEPSGVDFDGGTP